mmetsp:Transcript_18532/g.55932  ORF Transcript_18532/g.55932 Transcript_18532/m.55932 type:complete len:117 (-) Transcript_18532:217-567(-)
MERSDFLPVARLQELASQVDPGLKLETEAEQVLQDVADDFVENVVAFACQLAAHRGSRTLETKDVQLALEKLWDMRLPGIGDSSAELRIVQRRPQAFSDAYKQRLNLVRKSQARAQ